VKETDFWNYINKLNWDETGDDDAVIEPAIKALSKLDVQEIYDFEEILSQKLFALDTINHAKEIGEDAYKNESEYFSKDAFLYARCVIVANGKDCFEHMLSNPKDFPKDMEFEALLSISQEAYELKTDQEWEFVAKTDYETFSNKAGWK
jgi:hypothetical protein